jgi:hypothetical protein
MIMSSFFPHKSLKKTEEKSKNKQKMKEKNELWISNKI